MTNKTAGGGRKFSTSLIIGLLLVPMSAVAAVALVNPDASADTEETAAAEIVVADTTTTTVAEVAEVPEFSSADDLAAACGEQGLALATKEADGSISALEQAALDSLRAICTSEGLELPGPPAPEAVVETVTVVAASTGGGSSTSTTSSDDSASAEFEEKYAETVAYINAAIADGASGEKIDLATRLVAEAAALADSGDYASGMAKLDSARDAADQAARSSSHDDDDDDDHDDDDHHDDHDDDHGDDDEGEH